MRKSAPMKQLHNTGCTR